MRVAKFALYLVSLGSVVLGARSSLGTPLSPWIVGGWALFYVALLALGLLAPRLGMFVDVADPPRPPHGLAVIACDPERATEVGARIARDSIRVVLAVPPKGELWETSVGVVSAAWFEAPLRSLLSVAGLRQYVGAFARTPPNPAYGRVAVLASPFVTPPMARFQRALELVFLVPSFIVKGDALEPEWEEALHRANLRGGILVVDVRGCNEVVSQGVLARLERIKNDLVDPAAWLTSEA